MSNEKPDKESQTEEPTEHKLHKAEEKGNLPFSKELPIFFSFIALSLISVFIVFPAFKKISSMLMQIFDRLEDWRIERVEDFKNMIFFVGKTVALSLAPILLTIMIMGVGATMVQNAPRFIGERIRPKLSNISPASGFKRIFGKAGFVEFLKAITKLFGVTIIVYLIFFRHNTIFVDALITEPSFLPELIRSQLSKLFIANAVAIVALAGFDIAWSRISWRQRLRMTKQEMKDELKQTEGDPAIKTRMRSLGRDRNRRQMIANTAQATLVIANPSHFSIALRYSPPEDIAPFVIAKGQDILALKIRKIADQNKIPVFENIILARALYKQTEINQTIAPEFYQAVAELIRYINMISSK